MRLLLALAAALILTACDSTDSDYIPYAIKGFDVFVYNDATNYEYYAGRVDASYSNADDKLSNDVVILAHSTARQNRLGQNWSYMACTVTSDSVCLTTVR